MTKLQQQLRNLVKDERGNILMTFGLTSMVAIAAVGGAVDFGRANHEKSKMQNVLDAALVSGVAKYRETSDWAAAKTEAAAIFQATFTNAVSPSANVPNPTAAVNQAKVTITQAGNTLTGSATMTVGTPFINLITGRNISTLVAGSSIPASGKQVEVALMVDLTGSMGWSAASGASPLACTTVSSPSSKLDYLKCAGEDLLNILLPASGANNSAVRIGVAPFADYVNAGEYADNVTGQAATGGTYATLTNLASTKQGAFTGSYSGTSTVGSQFGSMGSTATSGATTTTSGATYTNSYCSSPLTTPTSSTPGTLHGTLATRDSDRYWGKTVTVTGTKPSSILEANDTQRSSASGRKADNLSSLERHDNSWNWNDGDGSLTSGYYAPIVTNATGLTAKTKDKDGTMRAVGVKITYDSGWSETPPAGITKNTNGYWKVSSWNGTDWNYTWVAAPSNDNNRDMFIPLYDGVETGYVAGTAATTKVECVSTATSQPSSKLISCVTERMNGTSLDYTADAPSTGRYVGTYNHGTTSKSNYSSDGKCYVGGRELPAVIPLTNVRSTLTTFFSNATAGGATPGHLGTAWASYLLSPTWSDIWPAEAAPTAYNSTNIKKYAILMTDGEYNVYYQAGGITSSQSAKQALMLCKQMRDNGIHVFTVGFGFAANATPPTADIEGMSDTDRTTALTLNTFTANQKALDTLAKCASSNSSYKFPYDGQALRDAFKSIATSISANVSTGSGRLTD
jgi:Flp pilus assembly protein TadG